VTWAKQYEGSTEGMTRVRQYILVLNAGSSSLKFALFGSELPREILRGQISGIGTRPVLEIDRERQELPDGTAYVEGLELVCNLLEDRGVAVNTLTSVGHRIVHGGERYVSPVIVSDDILDALDGLRRLAPLHLPFGLGVLRMAKAMMPDMAHVACFDTAFHATQPDVATRLPLPQEYRDKGYRRYGFHGLNYAHVVHALPEMTGKPLPRRLLAAHLGSGASMCAILDGKSVATTMGFSTADGLVMGTRTGSIDPGVIVALLRDEHLTLDQLEDLLYRKSGLLGLSGISADMRDLLASRDKAAREAVDYYCYSAARHAASLIPALGGLDAIVFTGGIGEHAEPVRLAIINHLGWLKVPTANVHVIAANEELTIARETKALIMA
jgi:acetate kinase